MEGTALVEIATVVYVATQPTMSMLQVCAQHSLAWMIHAANVLSMLKAAEMLMLKTTIRMVVMILGSFK